MNDPIKQAEMALDRMFSRSAPIDSLIELQGFAAGLSIAIAVIINTAPDDENLRRDITRLIDEMTASNLSSGRMSTEKASLTNSGLQRALRMMAAQSDQVLT